MSCVRPVLRIMSPSYPRESPKLSKRVYPESSAISTYPRECARFPRFSLFCYQARSGSHFLSLCHRLFARGGRFQPSRETSAAIGSPDFALQGITNFKSAPSSHRRVLLHASRCIYDSRIGFLPPVSCAVPPPCAHEGAG